jgi:hypothetical protein
MRRFSHVLATAVIVCALTVPVASAADGPDRDRGDARSRIVRIIKKLIKATLGDELSVPHP